MSLVQVADLAARLDDPDLRVCDVRWFLGRPGDGRRAYEAGHIPGAGFLDIDGDLAAPPGPGRHPLPHPASFLATLAARGIGTRHTVVAYDDSNGSIAVRLWWMLEALGHRRVGLLDGGFAAWTAAGQPVSTAPTTWPPVEPGEAIALPAGVAAEGGWPGAIERDELRARLGVVTLLDVRAPERYRGETEPIDPVAGHIPTAISAPIAGNVGPDGRFLDPAALAERYRRLLDGAPGAAAGAAAGVASRPVVVQCGSGVNACHAAFAMRLAGLPDPLLYAGSYSDWTRAGLPVVTSPEPGEPGAARG
jgi:thiosulfate/3-mercaptopyruvate sulfurtransferase